MMRNVLVLACLQAALVLFVAPRPAEGQRRPVDTAFARVEVEIVSRDTFATLTRPQLSTEALDQVPVPTGYTFPADSVRKDWRRKLVPYALGGAVIGAVLGYALMPKSCDVGDNMFCQYTLAAYPVLGAGAGASAGIIFGVLRDQ